MKYDKYLPIGTVVLLKGATKKLMITGFCVSSSDDDTVYDYSGCMYPEGLLSSSENCVFNHSQIKQIYYIGFVDEEEKSFKKKLKELVLKSN